MLKIGKLILNSNLILAPMAGISDLPFRMLNRKFGCELAFVEMINCRSVSHKSKRTHKMLSSLPQDRPLGIQLLGCEPKFILRAIEVINGYEFDVLDFNSACPAKKVIRRGEGAGLLREPKKLQELLRLIVKNSQKPVTVKIRSGWDESSVNAKDVALAVEDAGVKAIFIHGRTKTQGYSGKVGYNVIAEVKKSVSVPVIASGDILSPPLAEKMFRETGCDALAFARGALGNPWLIRETREYLKSGIIPARPVLNEIIDTMQEHLQACIDFYGEREAVMIFRKFFGWYTKGFRKVRPLRDKVSSAKTLAAMLELFEKLRSTQKVRHAY